MYGQETRSSQADRTMSQDEELWSESSRFGYEIYLLKDYLNRTRSFKRKRKSKRKGYRTPDRMSVCRVVPVWRTAQRGGQHKQTVVTDFGGKCQLINRLERGKIKEI